MVERLKVQALAFIVCVSKYMCSSAAAGTLHCQQQIRVYERGNVEV